MLGDTVGRTPGAYGFIVSCRLGAYVTPDDLVMTAKLVLQRNGGTKLHPLSQDWWFPGGSGPAALQLDMVCGGPHGGPGGSTHLHTPLGTVTPMIRITPTLSLVCARCTCAPTHESAACTP
jgi:hypothetical protein